MSKAVYLAGDFSGIQRYVLGVKSAGKAQGRSACEPGLSCSNSLNMPHFGR